jgi:hypothetical protein
MAAKALWDRERHQEAIPTLAALLQNPKQDVLVLREAIRVLGAIGPDARGAARALREVLTSTTNPALRQAAEAALKKIEK